MFGSKGLLIAVVLVSVVAYKINNVYVIENFENPYRYKIFHAIVNAISTIVSIMIPIFVCKRNSIIYMCIYSQTFSTDLK